MAKFILKRLLYSIVVMLCISLLVFLLLRIGGGDPVRLFLGDTATEEQVEAKRVELGFDQPIFVQYGMFLGQLVRGDFGTSIFYNQPVLELIGPALLNTLKLTLAGMIFALLIAIPMGLIAGVKRGSVADVCATGVALLGTSLSPVWIGIVLILIFSTTLGWLPPMGDETFAHIILPAITMGASLAAITMRMIRSGMIDTLEEDYILATRARGIPNRKVVFKYALKNVMLPVITIVGMQVGTFLGGAVVTEQVFAWNGVGRLMVSGINKKDFPIVQGSLLVVSFLFVLINLLVDVLYMFVDPRLRIVSSKRRKKMANKVLNEGEVATNA